jgi:hypothetical protein
MRIAEVIAANPDHSTAEIAKIANSSEGYVRTVRALMRKEGKL